MNRPLAWWFVDRTTGRVVIAQSPNPALLVWIASYAARVFTGPDLDVTLRTIGSGALIVWSLDELLRGVTPVRRLFGVVVLGWQLARLFAG